MAKLSWVVTSTEEGMTLQAFLRQKCPSAPSAKAIKRAIDSKYCTLDGRIETFSSHLLRKGNRVELDLSAFNRHQAVLSPTILYEDNDLIICNKPAGMVSENRYFNEQFPRFSKKLQLVHRLDKETSGAIILTKNTKMKEKMEELFSKREVDKVYLALVDGELDKEEGKIDTFLAPKLRYEGQTIYQIAQKGKRAITYWKCLKKGERASFLLCEPITGRTHQLRVHLSGIGHPILGDVQYAKKFRCPVHPKRHLLHAYLIIFIHPLSKKKIEVTAPIPLDFKQALQELKAYPDGASGLAFSRIKRG